MIPIPAQEMKNCMNFITSCLFYTGFWPPSPGVGESRVALRVWRRLFPRVQLARMIYGIFAQAYNVYLDWGTIGNMLEYLTILMIEVKLLVCLFVLMFRQSEFADVVRYLREKQVLLRGDGETKEQCRIMDRTNWYTHYVTVVMLAGLATCYVLVALVLFVHGLQHREIPFRKWFPYDTTFTPFFEVTLATVMVTQTFDLIVIFLFDLLFLAIFFQLIGQFMLLNYKLANMSELVSAEVHRILTAERLKLMREHSDGMTTLSANNVSVRSVDERGNSNKRFNRKQNAPRIDDGYQFPTVEVDRELSAARFLQDCVEHHIELVKISETVESLFKTQLQYQVIANGIVCVVVIYIAKLSLSVDFKVAVVSCVVLACTIEFFMFCALGTLLLKYSSDLSVSAYSGGWEGMSRRVKTSLQIIMAQRGVVFTAFVVYPITVETFDAVIKFSYSVYTVADSALLALQNTAHGGQLP